MALSPQRRKELESILGPVPVKSGATPAVPAVLTPQERIQQLREYAKQPAAPTLKQILTKDQQKAQIDTAITHDDQGVEVGKRDGFFDRLSDRFSKRKQTMKEADAREQRGEQGKVKTLVQKAGEVGFGISDTITEGLSSGLRSLPGEAEDAVQTKPGASYEERRQELASAKSIEGRVRTLGRQFLGDPGVVGGLEQAAPTITKADEYLQEHPTVKGGVGIASGVTDVLGLSALAKKPLKEGVEIAAETAKASARAAKKSVEVVKATPVVRGTVSTVTSVGRDLGQALGKAKNNIQVNRQATKEVEEQVLRAKPAAQKAIRSGVDIRDANFITEKSPAVIKKGREMLTKAQELIAGKKSDPADVVGQEFLNKFKAVDQARKNAGKSLGDYAKTIPDEKLRGVNIAMLDRIKSVPGLEGIKMKLSPKGWNLDFKATNLSRNKEAQKYIVEAFNDATKRGGQRLHQLRQELFEELNLKSSTRVKKLETLDDKAINAMRQGISDVLDGANDQYKALNQRYATFENALKGFRNKVKSVDGADEDILSMRLSQIARRTTSNAGADALNVLRQLEEAAKLAGLKSDIDIVDLQELMNIIENYFDVSKRTGFKKQISEGVADTIPTSKRDLLGRVIEKGLEKTLDVRQSVVVRQKALADLFDALLKEDQLGLGGLMQRTPIPRALKKIKIR